MKAKDYLEKIKASDDKQAEFARCVTEIIFEARDIAKTRHTENDAALISIFKEQELKFHALCRLIDKQDFDFKAIPEGFRNTIKELTPELYAMIW